MTENEKIIYDESAIDRAITRISHEIIERNADEKELCIIGIYRRGISIGSQIAENIEKFSDVRVNFGTLDITLFRDDLTAVVDDPVV